MFKDDVSNPQGSGGGSLNNTLVCFSVLHESFLRLSNQRSQGKMVNPINFVGMVCGDFYGKFYSKPSPTK